MVKDIKIKKLSYFGSYKKSNYDKNVLNGICFFSFSLKVNNILIFPYF